MITTAVLIPHQQIPDKGAFRLTMDITGEVGISADDAQRAVNRYVRRNVSYLFRAAVPHLTLINNTICWQHPILLTYPSYGTVGKIGHINVNIQTGDLLIDDQTIETLLKQADELAERTSYQTTPTS